MVISKMLVSFVADFLLPSRTDTAKQVRKAAPTLGAVEANTGS